MFYHAKNSTVTMNHTKMDYITFGTGSKTLVVLPGLSTRGVRGLALPVAYLYRIFAKEYKVYVFDRVADIPKDYTIRDLAADTAQAMELLGLSAADVVGVSQGGMMAQYLAIEYPHLVHKLVLAITMSRGNATVQKVIETWVALSEKRDYKTLTADMMERMYSESYIKKSRWMFPILSRYNTPKNPVRFERLAKACFTCDTYDKLHQIQCPVLVLGGKLDRVVTVEASEEMIEKLNCEYYIYEDMGHSVHEKARDFNRRIWEFLERIMR